MDNSKTAARTHGTCAYCGRGARKLNAQGAVAKHGFRRQRYASNITSHCPGSFVSPLELTDALSDDLAYIRGTVTTFNAEGTPEGTEAAARQSARADAIEARIARAAK